MSIKWKRETLVLLLGDILCFILSLWLTLVLRYGFSDAVSAFSEHIRPFSLLFLLWVIVFFIVGLYDKQTNSLKRKLPNLILNSEIANSVIAIIFFYFSPYLGITPKVNLLLYLIISLGLIALWRISLADLAYGGRTEKALIVGNSKETFEILEQVNKDPIYKMTLSAARNVDKSMISLVKGSKIFTLVLDPRSSLYEQANSPLSELMFSDVKFIDIETFYEDVFKKVSLSMVDDSWFLRNVSNYPRVIYDFLKRLMDISMSFVLGIISLLIYPFVYVAIKLDDGGPVFIVQERIGKNNVVIRILKLRSMISNDRGKWPEQEDKRITKIGKFLRKTRIDELPQLWNVFKGDISLIGPRPDIIGLGEQLSQQIPYYKMRNLIKPGLSGWAQINQDLPPHSLEETKERLAYDFYYLKNRSFALDIEIALKTIKTLLSRAGK